MSAAAAKTLAPSLRSSGSSKWRRYETAFVLRSSRIRRIFLRSRRATGCASDTNKANTPARCGARRSKTEAVAQVMRFDVAVAGLGGMGSAIAAQCAARGHSVIGIEQFGPAHDRGSSHGKTRMIRKAYFEDPAYVPLVLRAFELWRELEQRSGEQLLRITGVLSVGREQSEIISRTQTAAAKHDLALEWLSRDQIRKRYPM